MRLPIACSTGGVALFRPRWLASILVLVGVAIGAGCDSKETGHGVAPKAGVQENAKGELRHVLRLDPKKIINETGFAFTYSAPQFAGEGDTLGQSTRSPYSLLEHGKLLGPPHSGHQDIRQNGKGRWSHWGGTIYFSSSDGTDPRQNNREYVLAK